MTGLELNILVGVVGAAISIVAIITVWRHFQITKHLAEVEEDLVNYYTPDVLEKEKPKVEEDISDVDQTDTEKPDSEGPDTVTEVSGSESESSD